MSEKIEPALSADEWASGHGRWATTGLDHPVAIAWCNATLPDSDRRKITRASVAVLRKLIGAMYGDENGGVLNGVYTSPAENRQLWSLADALESYLPPVDVE